MSCVLLFLRCACVRARVCVPLQLNTFNDGSSKCSTRKSVKAVTRCAVYMWTMYAQFGSIHTWIYSTNETTEQPNRKFIACTLKWIRQKHNFRVPRKKQQQQIVIFLTQPRPDFIIIIRRCELYDKPAPISWWGNKKSDRSTTSESIKYRISEWKCFQENCQRWNVSQFCAAWRALSFKSFPVRNKMWHFELIKRNFSDNIPANRCFIWRRLLNSR